MKKLIYSLLVLVGLSGCTSQFEDNSLNTSKDENCDFRSRSEIAELARMLQNETNPPTHSRYNDLDILPILGHTSRGESDTLLYAVNYGNDNGFAVFTANKTDVPVIAWCTSGTFTENTDNPGMKLMLENSKEFVASGKAAIGGLDPGDSTISFPKADTITLHMQDGPRLETQWGQGWPANIYCPNKIAGCSPIAVAQMCGYFKEPQSITISYNQQVTPYSLYPAWDEIVKHLPGNLGLTPSQQQIEQHYAKCASAAIYHDQLAKFARQLGFLMGASYRQDETGAWPWSTARVLLGDYLVSDVSSFETLYDSLVRPNTLALVVGWWNPASGGHTWVADGIAQIKTTVYYGINNKLSKVIRLDNYVHHNWGWDGSNNVFALDGLLDPDFPTNFPSSEEVSNAGGYKYRLECMIFRKPNLMQ